MPTVEASHRLEYGSSSVEYRIIHSDRKRLRLTVTPTGLLQVVAPHWADTERVNQLVQERAPWVFRKLRQVEAYHPLPKPLNYISGETVLYLGRQYRLKVHQGPHSPAKLRGRFLHVTVPDKTNLASVESAVTHWYRIRAESVFKRTLDKCLPIASRHGIQPPKITIRKMRTRWGSCTANGRITLNLHLIQTPSHCIEYVVMHELCHLKHHNHSKAFYKLLSTCMPDWQTRKSLLNRIGIIHFA
jgi:hypothetical protein